MNSITQKIKTAFNVFDEAMQPFIENPLKRPSKIGLYFYGWLLVNVLYFALFIVFGIEYANEFATVQRVDVYAVSILNALLLGVFLYRPFAYIWNIFLKLGPGGGKSLFQELCTNKEKVPLDGLFNFLRIPVEERFVALSIGIFVCAFAITYGSAIVVYNLFDSFTLAFLVFIFLAASSVPHKITIFTFALIEAVFGKRAKDANG